ncbi:MAG: hypothetical protein ACYDG6_00350 [Thermincolia bacterium]
MNVKNLVIMMFTSLWVMGFFGVMFEKIARPKEVKIPVWLSRILFVINFGGVSKFFYYYQITLYIISLGLVIGSLTGLFGNYTLYVVFRLYVIIVFVVALYGVIMVLRYLRQRAHLRRIANENSQNVKTTK